MEYPKGGGVLTGNHRRAHELFWIGKILWAKRYQSGQVLKTLGMRVSTGNFSPDLNPICKTLKPVCKTLGRVCMTLKVCL